MKDKEEKAKEYAESIFIIEEDKLMNSGNQLAYYYKNCKNDFQAGYDAGFEAGKQEREREIIEQLKTQLETMEELPFHSKDFLDGLEQAIYIIAPLKLDDKQKTELENLSK